MEQTYRGHTYKIEQDIHFDDSPDNWGDDSLFLVAYDSRNFHVTRDTIITKDDARAHFNGDVLSQADDYHIFSLRAYIHSGVALSLDTGGQFGCRWDSGWIGLVLASKTEFATREAAEKAAGSLVNTWNDYLSGNIWGYDIPELDDSCWGFIGDQELVEVEVKRAIDYHMTTVYHQMLLPFV